MIKLALNERFSLKITMDEGYIFQKELGDLSEAIGIIRLTNTCGKLQRECKPQWWAC